MYYFDTTISNKYSVNTYSLLSTVKDKKSYVSRREIEGADRARDLQEKKSGLFYKTTKISLPTIESSTPKLPLIASTGMKPSMDQELQS